MFVSDNTIAAQGLGKYFKILERSSAKIGMKLATNVLKNLQEHWRLEQILVVQLYLKILSQSSVPDVTRNWHSESADPAKALDLSLAKQTNKQTNKKFCPHRGSNSRPSRF